jgi:hypothetical protein
MNTLKPWYMSRTIWASLVAVAASIGGLFGFAVEDADTEALAEAVMQTIVAVAALVAILGRLGARERIG